MVLVFIVALAALIAGCAQPEMSAADQRAYAKRSGFDSQKATAFVDALQAIPPSQRTQYLNQHPADVRNMALDRDPQLQMKFRSLIVNHT